MKKKTVLFYSNASWLKTGFGKNAKNILSYLYKTGKYNLINLCGGVHCSDPMLNSTPWLSVPALPDNPQEIKDAERDPVLFNLMKYGNAVVNKVVNENKVDAIIVCEDPWCISLDHPFVGKIPMAMWTTPDSLPILPQIADQATKIKDYWVWSNFATKELHKQGHENVKTLHGPVDPKNFYRLSDKERTLLREKNNISRDAFVISFVFRNQYRKSVDKLIEGYKIFKNQNPEVKNTFLLLHTNFSEGWNIQALSQEFGVAANEILTTYVCKSCKEYEVKAFTGQDKDCPHCGVKGVAPNQQNSGGSGQITINVIQGVNEKQLNEVYNLSNIYCHPFNSGGQELPIQEAKLCELVTLVTDYSCGQEMCEDAAYSFPLEYSIYKDLNQNHFNKAVTYPSSIAKQIAKCYFMKPEKLAEMGRKGRDWVLKNYSIEKIGGFIENFIDKAEHNYDYISVYQPKNVDAQIPDIQDEDVWLRTIYKEILNMDDPREGVDYWKGELKKGASRAQVHDFFRNVAMQENQKHQHMDFGDLLIKNNKKQLAIIQPGSIGDLIGILGILPSIRERYKDWNIYMVTEPRYFEIFDGCEFIDKILPFQPWMDQNFANEGIGTQKGYFDIAYQPFWRPQRSANYTHNGIDTLALDIHE